MQSNGYTEEKYLPINEISKRYGISPQTLRFWHYTKQIKSLPKKFHNSKLYFLISDIEKTINSKKTA